MTANGADAPTLTPLEMARNCAAAVARRAEHAERDPLGSYIQQAGTQAHQTAQLAANLALVSMAEDLHRIVGVMLGHAPEDHP